eukprot:Transcript_9892.p1 GENE.Transcript_9892~~Transcript_9892.p1  ORF type:complete len:992 (-),score=337.45 Transcript_9892:396-3335(-)
MAAEPDSSFSTALDALYATSQPRKDAPTLGAPVPRKDAAAISEDLSAILLRRYALEQQAKRPTAPPVGAPGSVAELKELDVQAIECALAALQARVDSVDGELVRLRAEARVRDREALPGLRETGAALEAIGGGMDSLVGSIGETAALAERVSARVQVIDLQRARVAETLARLDEVMGLEQSSDVVSRAMETADFESAVAHVHRLREASGRADSAPVEPAMLAKMAEVQRSLQQQARALLLAAASRPAPLEPRRSFCALGAARAAPAPCPSKRAAAAAADRPAPESVLAIVWAPARYPAGATAAGRGARGLAPARRHGRGGRRRRAEGAALLQAARPARRSRAGGSDLLSLLLRATPLHRPPARARARAGLARRRRRRRRGARLVAAGARPAGQGAPEGCGAVQRRVRGAGRAGGRRGGAAAAGGGGARHERRARLGAGRALLGGGAGALAHRGGGGAAGERRGARRGGGAARARGGARWLGKRSRSAPPAPRGPTRSRPRVRLRRLRRHQRWRERPPTQRFALPPDVGVLRFVFAQAEPLLDELAAILRGAAQYDAFMARLVPPNAPPLALRDAPPMRELARGLTVLAHALAWVSMHKAVRLDAAEEQKEEAAGGGGGGGGSKAPPPTTSLAVVDNAFYVLQRLLRRAAHCGDAAIGEAAVDAAASLLTRPLLEHLGRPLRQQTISAKLSDKLAGAALAGAQAIVTNASEGGGMGAQASSTVGAAALVGAADRLAVSAAATARQAALQRALNALHQCAQYTPKLWAQARDELSRALPAAVLPGVRARLAAAQQVEAALQAALEEGLTQLSATLLPRLKLRLEPFGTASYVLESEANFAAAESDSFAAGYLAELEATLNTLRPHLAAPVLDQLLQLLVKASAERLEALLLAKKLDPLGALQLDRELRTLAKRLTELAARSVRDKLTRLTQMATLLNLERVAELAELWGDGGWKLSAAEARQVLALRVDFRKEAIAQLALD